MRLPDAWWRGLRFCAAAVLLAILQSSAYGAAAMAPALDRWIGSWRGTGTNAGSPADVKLNWERVLDGRFVQLSLHIEVGPPEARQQFDGLGVYWAQPDGSVRARWFDSQGSAFAITAHLDADSLVSIWGDEREPHGRSTYRLTGRDSLEVLDEVRAADGSWRQFAHYTLQRTLD